MHPRFRHSRGLERMLAYSLAAIVVGAAPARAQLGPTYTLGANAGLVVPVSDLSNFTSSGYTIAATLGMHQSLSPLAFRFEGSFTELPWSDNAGNSGAKHRVYGFSLDGIFNLGQASTNGGLYATGGVGYFGWKDTGLQTFFGSNETQTTWDFGINAGLGYYLPLSGFTVYFEGRYRYIFSNPGQAMFPITVGVAF
jgi:hypothetical protein